MTSAASPEITVRYEGPGTSTELWGVTQANFSVGVPGRHAKEAAIQLNDAAARYLESELGQENTAEARQDLAIRVGEYLLRTKADAGAHIDSLTMVSVALLQENPAVLEHLRANRS